MNRLILRGVSENNLKGFDLEIEHNQLVAITGVSGSGKSTLAFDTIYAEGGRRYIETFSPYTRQYLERLHQPKLTSVEGMRPALALEQHKRSVSSRSTVGTVTEINDYLKILWSRAALLRSPDTGQPIERGSAVNATKAVVSRVESGYAGTVLVCFPVKLTGVASAKGLAESLESEGFLRFYDTVSSEVKKLGALDEQAFADCGSGELLIVADRVQIKREAGNSVQMTRRLIASISQAYGFGRGLCAIVFVGDRPAEIERFALGYRDPETGTIYPEPRPSLFSFNSPLGACPTCHGFGKTLSIDPQLCIPDFSKTINQDAIACWGTKSATYERKELRKYCKRAGIDINTPWGDLTQKVRDDIFFGPKDDDAFWGIEPWFRWLETRRHKMHVRIFLSRYRKEAVCSTCAGSRLTSQAILYTIADKALAEIWDMPIDEALTFFQGQAQTLSQDRAIEVVLDELLSRLGYLVDVGLGYLTLNRQTRTLSGGEGQRVGLTSLLGARLVSTDIVLDEPTIGLHPSDTSRLIKAIKTLRDRGNTVFVVEHDQEVIEAADEVIDLGPGAGNHGGEIVYQGPVEGLLNVEGSATGAFLQRKQVKPIAKVHSRERAAHVGDEKKLEILGARAHNLKNIDLSIPLERLVVLTGLSGSGKSTLARICINEAYDCLKRGRKSDFVNSLNGTEHVDEIVLVDQTPVGKTPRSNPATYTKAWDWIREMLAETEAAVRLGLGKSAFSFNVDGGRCPVCSGAGAIRVEMQFLADVFVECEACGGSRFQDKALTVRLGGWSVAELLQQSISDVDHMCLQFGDETRAEKIRSALKPLIDLGLGYLRLGHPMNSLSGGEAQRIKLASYLGASDKGKYLFVLDEPTTGLHPKNVSDLLRTFRTLIERGHSILCIEHNLLLVDDADWLIDLGPGGGVHGGSVVAQGLPDELLRDEIVVAQSATLDALMRYRTTRKLFGQKIVTQAKGARAGAKIAKLRESINIVGAKHHNLKNVSLSIPHNTLSVLTGVSGSGKSSLAFDIIFQEGQRRYIDCLSPYARQFIKQLSRAEVDLVDGIPPTIAVSQKTAPPLGVSTIATVTEVYQFLRLLFAKVGKQHCVEDGSSVESLSAGGIAEQIAKRFGKERIYLLAPVVSGRKGYHNDLFRRAARAEIDRAFIDGTLCTIHPELRLERHKLHWVSLLVGSIANSGASAHMLLAAVEQCLLLGNGTVEVFVGSVQGDPHVFSVDRACPECGRGYRELDPQDFSFRSLRGMCSACKGKGVVEKRGVAHTCPECDGARIGAIGRSVTFANSKISELAQMKARELLVFLEGAEFERRLMPVVEPILRELKSRLKVIIDVGLDYLSLNREASTLSGGEAQRLRLSRSLGSPLTGVCYVLDEPSIGLHPSDHGRLMGLLKRLKDEGNTVLVVEHDEDTICSAEHIIDVGPGGGSDGGQIVYQGSVSGLKACARSVTGKALNEREGRIYGSNRPEGAVPGSCGFLRLVGARANNLKNVNVDFPLNALTVVCGLSGAGKSSLVHGSLIPAVSAMLDGRKVAHPTWESLQGGSGIKRIVEIDQTPVGKTSSSCPVSYLGVLDEIRKVYAQMPEARARGCSPSYFSFNSGKGKCEACQGKGFVKVPMSFLPEAITVCEVCNGLRYNEEAQGIVFKGVSIGDLLQKTFAQAREMFLQHRRVLRAMEYVLALGLDYLTLGQPTHSLSGGEAQRLKIAKELSLREAEDTLYVIDEPTVGLHMSDVDKLKAVLHQLVAKGNTVVVIEHDIDVIRDADYLVELGPGPGESGGEIVFSGDVGDLVSGDVKTATKSVLVRGASKKGKRAQG